MNWKLNYNSISKLVGKDGNEEEFFYFSKNNFDKNSIDSIAIGGFDGMHIAHQELFKT